MSSKLGRGVAAGAVGLVAVVGLATMLDDGGEKANEIIDTSESVGSNFAESSGHLARTISGEVADTGHQVADDAGGLATRGAGALSGGASGAAGGAPAVGGEGGSRAPQVGGG